MGFAFQALNEYEFVLFNAEGGTSNLRAEAEPVTKDYFTSVTRVYGETFNKTSASIWRSFVATLQVRSRLEPRRQALLGRLARIRKVKAN